MEQAFQELSAEAAHTLRALQARPSLSGNLDPTAAAAAAAAAACQDC